MTAINGSRGSERIFQSRERGEKWGEGGGGVEKEEVIYVFFFSFFSRTSFSHRSIPNKSGSVKSKAFIQVAHGAGA